ncbi:hypothetical protein CS0771_57290 [Catellatospora sp. IY07-71]|uniref:BREX-2 system phosphatase PglZ n=1 Tax=Catellatospora sp. IY07-71 TaxID=2728827 RepID=UPI001BB55727|nr:BREX-2 system phosphatase PglZ [Catellatospora sp. IY07-71]BCJ76185.1 hypothetical protein CS0771_57290 [Catellatospora sp. IY07-71]
MSREAVRPAAVRRKVENWLQENDRQPAIALRARPAWDGDPLLTVGDATARIVPCATPLAARAALHERHGDERIVLLTELNDTELGDGILAHLSRHTVRSIDQWDLVRQMFGLKHLDPTFTDPARGGGRWIADALTEYAPADGWPVPPGTVLTREFALRCLAIQLLHLRDRELDTAVDLDIAGLLQWSTLAQPQLDFIALPTPVVDGVSRFISDAAGPAATPVMCAVRAGHGVDAIALGLLASALWPQRTPAEPNTQVVVARTRLEPYFGGTRLTDTQARAFAAAAEAWVDRTLDTGARTEVGRVLARAESIAAQIGAEPLLGGSDLLPAGFTQRLRTFADAVRLAVPAAGNAAPDMVAAAQRALGPVEQHRAGTPSRVETARMAVRLLRWLSDPDGSAPATLLAALDRQVTGDGWVDRARLDLFAGDVDPHVADAYGRLHRAVDARRARHDEQFARLLAADTAADSEPGALLRVEDVLDRVVQPIVSNGRRVLLLILDGLSVAASTELAESLTRSGSWLELTPDGGARTGVLAALPTITEVSRCSLLSGRIAVGGQAQEQAAFRQRFPDGVLLHKADLRAGAGAVLDGEVLTAIGNAFTPVVAAVINTVDDALDRSDPGTIVWGEDTILAVKDLLTLAQDRVVVIVSDHGHVIDRGPEAVVQTTPERDNRWRAAAPPAGDGEVAVRGARVAKGDGSVVLPWREQLRYGPRKAGYHGGAAPAEAVIPLIVLATDETAVPGWSGAPVASPTWWRETVPEPEADTPAPAARPRGGTKQPKQPVQDTALFDLTPAMAPATAAPAEPDTAEASLVERLLAGKVYQQRKDTRAPLPDERVAALLNALLAGNGRASMDTLAAHASVPVHRISGTVTALRKLLQIEGYPVLTVDADGQTVKLDIGLLREQFGLDQP